MMNRPKTDVAELEGRSAAQELIDQAPTDAAEAQALKNEAPRFWAEFGVAVSSLPFVALILVPGQLKKGLMWYSSSHSLVLFSMTASVACLFWGNTHIKMLRFLSGKKIFAKVVFLALADLVRLLIMPDTGWEVSDRITAATLFVCRLSFFCLDSLKGMSRWFRLFTAFFFMFGNVFAIFQAYLLPQQCRQHVCIQLHLRLGLQWRRRSVLLTD